MNQSSWIFFLMVFSALVHYDVSGASRQERQNYQHLFDEANAKLQEIDESRSCPGTALTLTCGNGKCEPERGENELNCPGDCLPALVKSYNAQTLCKDVKKVFVPVSQSEVALIVQEAVRSGQNIRAIGNSHTSNEQLCTDGVVISTKALNHIIGLEKQSNSEVVTVEPGVTLSELTDWLDQRGKALGYNLIQYRGVSIAGAIATGAHGSSARHPGVLASSVVALSIVDSKGQRSEYSADATDPEIFKALRTSLGVTGIVVQIKLRIRSQFNLQVKTSYHSDAELFTQGGLVGQVSDCDFGQLLWFPHSKKFVKMCGKETLLLAERDAENSLLNPPVPNFIVKPYQVAFHYGACSSGLNCSLEDLRYASLTLIPPYKKRCLLGNLVNSRQVVGRSHRMMTSDLTSLSSAAHELDWEIAVPFSQAQKALAFISKRLADNRTCLPLTGLFIRYVMPEDTTLIAHTVAQGAFKAGEPAVLFELPSYMPVGLNPEMLAAYNQQFSGIAQTLITDFNGRAHWGKNNTAIFALQKGLGVFGDHLDRFRKIVHDFDPNGVFSNPFSANF
jgi:hypothetical protein